MTFTIFAFKVCAVHHSLTSGFYWVFCRIFSRLHIFLPCSDCSYEWLCISQPLLCAAEYWVFVCEVWKLTLVFLNHWLCSPITVSVNEVDAFILFNCDLPILRHSFRRHCSWITMHRKTVFPWWLNANYLPADGFTRSLSASGDALLNRWLLCNS